MQENFGLYGSCWYACKNSGKTIFESEEAV